MKPIAVFLVIALIPSATLAAHAKNVTTGGTSNEKSVSGVAGPAMAAGIPAPARPIRRRSTTPARRRCGKPRLRRRPRCTIPTDAAMQRMTF